MKNNLSIFTAALLLTTSVSAYELHLKDGWQMKGISVAFENMSDFNNSNCIDTVWKYTNESKSWAAFSPNSAMQDLIDNSSNVNNLTSIDIEDGFWIKANSDCILDGNTTLPVVDNTSKTLFSMNLNIGTSNGDDTVNKIIIDNNDNLIVSGTAYGSIYSGSTFGQQDAYILKFDSNNNFKWLREIGGTSGDYSTSISTDSNDNIYMILNTTSESFDGIDLDVYITSILISYDKDGNKNWTKAITTEKNAYLNATDIVIDNNDNIYLVGNLEEGTSLNDNNSSGLMDAFLLKYDTNGTVTWTKLLGTTSADNGYAITADNDNNIYIAGSTDGNLDDITSNGSTDGFIAKYNSSGTLLQTKLIGGSNIDEITNLEYFNNNLYAVGKSKSNLINYTDINNSTSHYVTFTSKLDTDLEQPIEWMKVSESNADLNPSSLYVDNAGIVIAGSTDSTSYNSLDSHGKKDIFVSYYDLDGNNSANDLLGAEGDDIPNTILHYNNTYLIGGSTTSQNFTTEPNQGANDGFMLKYELN